MGRTTRQSAARTTAAAAVVVLGLAACGGDPEPGTGTTPAPEPSSTAPATSEEPDPDASASPTQSGGSAASASAPAEYATDPAQSDGFPEAVRAPAEGGELLLEAVRVGSHPGYERIVFEHAGDGVPGWRTEYVDQPVQPGSGRDVEMAGDAYLAVYVTGLQPGMAGEEHGHAVLDTGWSGQETFIEQTITTGVFEGAASYFVSLDAERGYAAAMYDDGRLVIDFED
ncbi:AMIN-like domain-containing (lipo)protein [Zhihengliuella salsuginis]|uniref:AMIN-like domain-containing protein n=1 Tax=Zhihengliuella salsuginis TaxID=578222 RepID=A0ABQ3GDQ1_9MICC|nr:hypothetical protein [Zhihengliuella salsuginis]GHD02714.1 hypothetical protein GCM10008096_08160 [Zhihengliuella salsuginis]